MDAVLLAGLTFVLGIATNWATTRRTLALQYDTELRRERLAVYSDLWSRLEVLNKYGRPSSRLSRVDTERLVADLKRWYFQVGGIYLSEPTRNDYFALRTRCSTRSPRLGSATTPSWRPPRMPPSSSFVCDRAGCAPASRATWALARCSSFGVSRTGRRFHPSWGLVGRTTRARLSGCRAGLRCGSGAGSSDGLSR